MAAAVTPNHYESLRVAPGAEDAVIRAAYRALMQAYHPDRNDDPEAQARAREITAAFAVLRDPEKRAAYDASQAFGNEWGAQAAFVGQRRPLPPMRNFGIASVALALVLSLAFALRPDSMPVSRPPAHRLAAAVPKTAHVQPAVTPHTARERTPAPVVEAAPVRIVAAPAPVPPAALTHDAVSVQASKPRMEMPTHAVAKVEPPKAPAPIRMAAHETTTRAAHTSCDSQCTNDRKAKIEEMAASFLKQSLEHADWSKQQLLLSARNRSATSRTLCHSDECVTAAYLRQMRDTTDIMEGRIPGQ